LAAEVPTSAGDGGPDLRWRRRSWPSLAPEVGTPSSVLDGPVS